MSDSADRIGSSERASSPHDLSRGPSDAQLPPEWANLHRPPTGGAAEGLSYGVQRRPIGGGAGSHRHGVVPAPTGSPSADRLASGEPNQGVGENAPVRKMGPGVPAFAVVSLVIILGLLISTCGGSGGGTSGEPDPNRPSIDADLATDASCAEFLAASPSAQTDVARRQLDIGGVTDVAPGEVAAEIRSGCGVSPDKDIAEAGAVAVALLGGLG